jgi:signal transduction histidine kinase
MARASGVLKRAGPLVMTAVLVLVVLAAGGYALLDRAADRFVRQQAERTSSAWAAYIGEELPRIEKIAAGAPVSDEERAFLDGARRFGDIFRFKLFDAEGRLRLVSDDLDSSAAPSRDLGEHNPTAAAVLASGRPFTALKDGTANPQRPDVYAETYVPVVRRGEVVAISEVYVDQTATASALRADFRVFGLQVAGLTLVALLLPLAGLLLLARQLRAQNAALDKERLRAINAERAKATFLAHMSHELRTPLNAIQGMAQVMVRGDLGPIDNTRYREYAADIDGSAEHLLSLINDILDLAKVDAGKYELRESEVELDGLVESALRIVRAWHESDGIAVSDAQVVPGTRLRADPRALHQILLNLLSNAVKFTPAGGTIDVAAGLDDAGNCVISVRDTGYGIPADDLPHIVEPFNQARRRADLRHRQGTGLGLSLVDSLTTLHGGELRIESEVGLGTAVHVVLPPERVVAAPEVN